MEAVDGGHRADSRTGEGEKLMPCWDANVSASLSEGRFSMEMVALFALTALLLSGLGIYGVIS